MPLLTLAQFEGKIDDEVAWRKREISDYDGIVRSTTKNTLRDATVIRAGVCLLYAHFEGVTKEACSTYVHYIFQNRRLGQDLHPHLKAPYVLSKLRQVAGSGRAVDAIAAVHALRDIDSKRVLVQPSHVVKTDSNLSYAKLEDILYYLRIFDRAIELKENLIDEVILHARNNIAHGRYLKVDRDGYNEVFAFVKWYLDWLQNSLKSAAQNEQWRP